jgi:hypothetical protein
MQGRENLFCQPGIFLFIIVIRVSGSVLSVAAARSKSSDCPAVLLLMIPLRCIRLGRVCAYTVVVYVHT